MHFLILLLPFGLILLLARIVILIGILVSIWQCNIVGTLESDYPINTIGCFIQDSAGAHWVGRGTTATVNDGNWHHIVIVVTTSNTMVLYINGSTTGTQNESSGVLGSYSNTNNVRAANDYDSEIYNGAIDDVRIYNRAFSQSDADQLYTYTGALYNRINKAKINNAKITTGVYN